MEGFVKAPKSDPDDYIPLSSSSSSSTVVAFHSKEPSTPSSSLGLGDSEDGLLLIDESGGSEEEDEIVNNNNTSPFSSYAAAVKGPEEDRRIFVGNISEDTTEADIGSLFSSFGTVVGVGIPRIPYTAKSRGFAYVTFAAASSVSAVLASGKGFELHGETLEIQRAKKKAPGFPDPTPSTSSTMTNLGRLSRSQRKRRNRRKRAASRGGGGGGSSPMSGSSSSTSTGNNNPSPMGKRRRTMPSLSSGTENRKIFIGGISSKITSIDLRNYFSKWGDIEDAVAMKANRQSRGFGFVTFTDPSMLEACQAARPHYLEGNKVDTRRAIPKDEMDHCEGEIVTERLFVGELKESVEEKDLYSYFGQFGRVLSAELIMDRQTRRPRGFGYVSFEDYDAVDKIICLGEHKIHGRRINVEKAVESETYSKRKGVARVPAPWAISDRPWTISGGQGSFGQPIWPHMPSLPSTSGYYNVNQTLPFNPAPGFAAPWKKQQQQQDKWANFVPIGTQQHQGEAAANFHGGMSPRYQFAKEQTPTTYWETLTRFGDGQNIDWSANFGAVPAGTPRVLSGRYEGMSGGPDNNNPYFPSHYPRLSEYPSYRVPGGGSMAGPAAAPERRDPWMRYERRDEGELPINYAADK